MENGLETSKATGILEPNQNRWQASMPLINKEDVLAPGDNKIIPNTDVVAKVRKPFSPSPQNDLKLTRVLLEVH